MHHIYNCLNRCNSILLRTVDSSTIAYLSFIVDDAGHNLRATYFNADRDGHGESL